MRRKYFIIIDVGRNNLQKTGSKTLLNDMKQQLLCEKGSRKDESHIVICGLPPVAWGDQNSANVCPRAHRKRRPGSGNILFQRLMSSFSQEPTASLRGDHEL